MKTIIQATAIALTLTVAAVSSAQAGGGHQTYVEGYGHGTVVDTTSLGGFIYKSVVALGNFLVVKTDHSGYYGDEIIHIEGLDNRSVSDFDGNYLQRVLVQKGVGNYANQRRTGNGGSDVVEQYGGRNTAYTDVIGDHNRTYIEQHGRSTADVRLRGNNIKVNVVQR
ncbi:MAG: hypothetical protein ACSHWZ_19190 [Sulfitobacter sp.]